VLLPCVRFLSIVLLWCNQKRSAISDCGLWIGAERQPDEWTERNESDAKFESGVAFCSSDLSGAIMKSFPGLFHRPDKGPVAPFFGQT
jgi:hypothetical protein